MKMSARFADWEAKRVHSVSDWVAIDLGWELTHLEILLCRKDFTEEFASPNSQGVSQKPDLLDVVLSSQRRDVRLQVGFGVELQPLALKREDFLGCRHDNLRGSDLRNIVPSQNNISSLGEQ